MSPPCFPFQDNRQDAIAPRPRAPVPPPQQAPPIRLRPAALRRPHGRRLAEAARRLQEGQPQRRAAGRRADGAAALRPTLRGREHAADEAADLGQDEGPDPGAQPGGAGVRAPRDRVRLRGGVRLEVDERPGGRVQGGQPGQRDGPAHRR